MLIIQHSLHSSSLHLASLTSPSWPRCRPQPIRGRRVATLTNRRLSVSSLDPAECSQPIGLNPMMAPVWRSWVSEQTGARSSVGDTHSSQHSLAPAQCKSFSCEVRFLIETKGWECSNNFTHSTFLCCKRLTSENKNLSNLFSYLSGFAWTSVWETTSPNINFSKLCECN